MSGLQNELKQSRPFRNLREEAILNVWRTADVLAQRLHSLLKVRGMSQTQYNVLRILRGAGTQGLPCGEIGSRMLTHDPDVTRLIDRLVHRGLARRARLRKDRRVVLAKITPAGMSLLADLDPFVGQLIDRMMGHMKESRLKALIALLVEARNGSPGGGTTITREQG